ncbi:hypothetical protein B0H10DRAFT_1342849 [Mycena sp. CBHHK59/15]|nr:hypothetical protein B0H10DRAFT_1342849 [Mycena sp. CBHHK59/15]
MSDQVIARCTPFSTCHYRHHYGCCLVYMIFSLPPLLGSSTFFLDFDLGLGHIVLFLPRTTRFFSILGLAARRTICYVLPLAISFSLIFTYPIDSALSFALSLCPLLLGSFLIQVLPFGVGQALILSI